jgi:RNA polymerase sigma factor (sigma-70 family)
MPQPSIPAAGDRDPNQAMAETQVESAVEHLFRREWRGMVAALTRVFGLQNLGLVEDVVQETLLLALSQWSLAGIPTNPPGWLYRVARNKAIDVLRRERTGPHAAAASLSLPGEAEAAEQLLDRVFLDREIADDTLRMMFACCHPALPVESQIAMTLKILAGFSAAEIGRALLADEATIEKRIYRAKRKFRDSQIAFEVPGAEDLPGRLGAVLAVLYLMFNEGYNASFAVHPIRKDLCLEAMRLCRLLCDHRGGGQPQTFALMALMCFHGARFAGRLDGEGHLLTMEFQDRAQWSGPLIREGFDYLMRSGSGANIGATHIEAGIAALHCLAPRYEDTDWSGILELYDLLVAIKPTPVVALNRAIALAEVKGPQAGLDALAGLRAGRELDTYYLLSATLGELYRRIGARDLAIEHLTRAKAQTASVTEQRFLADKIAAC